LGREPVGSVLDRRSSWSWGLYADWCASWGREPLPASRQNLQEFLDAFPASRSTQVTRLAVILAVHAQAGLSVDVPRVTNPVSDLWTRVPGFLDPVEALAQVPRYRFPAGLVGRRDGFLIVLTGILGLTREQARQVIPDDITVDSGFITVHGRQVPARGASGECPRCGVAGWLSVIAPHYERLRGSYLPLLDPTTAEPEVHACKAEVGVLWRDGVSLLPSIDRTGAVGTGGALSIRAMTTIIGRRRIRSERVEKTGPVSVAVGRYQDATSGELAAAQDDVLDQVDHANRYLEELLAEAATLKRSLHRDGGV
jgi:hypothetical protein